MACHEETGGNPLMLRELVRAVAADGLAPLANTRFGISPLAEAVLSLRAPVHPSQHQPCLAKLGSVSQTPTGGSSDDERRRHKSGRAARRPFPLDRHSWSRA